MTGFGSGSGTSCAAVESGTVGSSIVLVVKLNGPGARAAAHIAARFDRIERARQQHEKVARIFNAPGRARRLVAGAEIDIARAGPTMAEAGVLRDDQAGRIW